MDPKLEEFLQRFRNRNQAPDPEPSWYTSKSLDELHNINKENGIYLNELQVGDFLFIQFEGAFIRIVLTSQGYTIQGFQHTPKPVPVSIRGSLTGYGYPVRADYVGKNNFLRYEVQGLGIGEMTSARILSIEHWRGEEPVRKVA